MIKTRSMDETVTLILTTACNLNCTYCYEHHKSRMNMDFLTAKAILDERLMDESKSDSRVIIELFGGEAFLNFSCMEQIVSYLRENMSIWKRPFTVFIDSNGTLVHGEIQRWLEENRDIVTCGLSLDGTKHMHDMNRSKSYDLIDFDFFKRMYPEQTVKMTVSHESLPWLAEGIIHIQQELGFRLTANLAYGIDWAPEDVQILAQQLTQLADFYVEHPDVPVCNIIGMDVSRLLEYPEELPVQRQACGSGLHMRAYMPDRRAYPCQMLTPLSLGEEKAAAFNAEIKREYDSCEINEACRSCPGRLLCPRCLGMNYAVGESIHHVDSNHCRLLKIQWQAAAYLQFKRWKLGRLQFGDESEELSILQGIRFAADMEI